MSRSEGHLISNAEKFRAYSDDTISTTAKLVNFGIDTDSTTREMLCQSTSDFAISHSAAGPWFKVPANILFSIPIQDANIGKVFVKSLAGTIEVQFLAWTY